MVLNLWGEEVTAEDLTHLDRMVAADPRERARQREKERRAAGNPMIAAAGPGPEGVKCKTCVSLRCVRMAGTYYKCTQRPIVMKQKLTHGTATDHRVNWPACAKYQAKEAKVE